MAVTTTPPNTKSLFYQAKAIHTKLNAQKIATLINTETLRQLKKGEITVRKECTPGMVYNAINELNENAHVDAMLQQIIAGEKHEELKALSN